MFLRNLFFYTALEEETYLFALKVEEVISPETSMNLYILNYMTSHSGRQRFFTFKAKIISNFA
jgi:hypothetical protein